MKCTTIKYTSFISENSEVKLLDTLCFIHSHIISHLFLVGDGHGDNGDDDDDDVDEGDANTEGNTHYMLHS